MIHGAIGSLRSLFYPAHCGLCGVGLEEQEGPEALICSGCLEKISPLPSQHCGICSHPMEGMLRCRNCDGRVWHLSVIVAGCRYEGAVRDLVQRFKYGRDQSLLPLLSMLMDRGLEDQAISGRKFDGVIPVPLHPLREREREFNQAQLLAVPVARRLGLPLLSPLRRKRATSPQAGFDRRHRMENLRGAFERRSGRGGFVPEGGVLLLVDDVATTGCTLDACAAVLREAGAAEVCGIVVARG